MFRVIVLLLTALVLNSGSVYAVTTPIFPVCSNPQGSVKVSYGSGTHGVPGLSQTFTGSDAVYAVSDNTLVQCLCVEGGEGIQTNWWKVSSLTDTEIEVLKNQGWFYIPNGANWGLSGESYLAINSAYACRNGLGGIGGAETLAGTGDSLTFYALGFFGLLFLILGLKKEKNA